IRCVPSCAVSNSIIYTYLENYPVGPFAKASGFPFKTGYPNPDEASAAIQSALNRPLGVLGGDGVSSCNGSQDCIERIADVAFEWAPQETNPNSSARYGQLYAYVFSHAQSGDITETIAFPNESGGQTPNVATHVLEPFKGGLTVDPNPAKNNAY